MGWGVVEELVTAEGLFYLFLAFWGDFRLFFTPVDGLLFAFGSKPLSFP